MTPNLKTLPTAPTHALKVALAGMALLREVGAHDPVLMRTVNDNWMRVAAELLTRLPKGMTEALVRRLRV